jgi:hypothetical protein
VAGMALETRKDTLVHPLIRGDFQSTFSCRYAAPRSMKKLVPSTGGVQGWVVAKRGPTPKADAFCPSREGIFKGAPHAALWQHQG